MRFRSSTVKLPLLPLQAVLFPGGLLRQRVWPARLGEAAHQRVRARVEEHRADHDPFAPQLLDQRQQVGQRTGAAHVHRDGDAALRAAVLESQEVAQQLGRQVVDAEEARVFQRVQRDRLAGPGDAGDEHHLVER